MSDVFFYNIKSVYSPLRGYLNIDNFYVKDGRFYLFNLKTDNSILDNHKLKRFDLNQGIIYPGFIDTHTHFIQGAIDLNSLDLQEAKSILDIKELLFGYIKDIDLDFYTAFGFDESKFKENVMPTKQDLDEVVSDKPVALVRKDHHSIVLNSAFERKLSLSSLDGIYRGRLSYKIKSDILKMYNKDFIINSLKKAEKLALANGITTINALEGGKLFPSSFVDTIIQFSKDSILDIIIFNQTTDINEVKRQGLTRIGGCLLIDGSIGSRTAALTFPYEDDKNNFGRLYFSYNQLYEFVKKAHLSDLQMAFHAIGDRAINLIVNIYDRVLKQYPKSDHRHRIEHVELATDKQIEKIAKNKIYLGVQPAFDYLWGNGMYKKRFSNKRTNPFKSFIDNSIIIAGGSDWDVTPLDALLGIYSAINHSIKSQRLNFKEAISLYTINAAKINFLEDKLGDIDKGLQADFLVFPEFLDNNLKQKVKYVFKKGNLVYRGI